MSTWEAFLVSHSTVQPRLYSASNKSGQESTRELPDLKTLNIQNWPETMASLLDRCTPGSESLHIYESQLQRVAQDIFSASDVEAKTQGWGLGNRSLLAVIAFGANGESSYGERHDEIKLKQMLFTRGIMTDALGRTKMLAVKTLWKNIYYIEPESDILTHSLYQVAGVTEGP